MEVEITEFMKLVGIEHSGSVTLFPHISGLESNHKDDWLYLGGKLLGRIARTRNVRSMASIAEGNGIAAIMALHLFPELQDLCVTDIRPNLMQIIRENIERNYSGSANISYRTGRDCQPLDGTFDLIYGNLPLIMTSAAEIGSRERGTTTLTDEAAYIHLSRGENDVLTKWSLLSQLEYLQQAKEKLNPGGSIATLIGGRVPYDSIRECFTRAGLEFELTHTGFMRQSDPEFIEDYRNEEDEKGIEFDFYNYEKAQGIFAGNGIESPGLIHGKGNKELREMLKYARINSKQAYQLYRQSRFVGHLAYAFEARQSSL